MISKKMSKAINEQINKELFSGYLYRSMGAYTAHNGLKGFTNWFEAQNLEEIKHAQKFYNYLIDQGEKVTLMAIEQPPVDFKSPLDLFEQTLEHEKKVTASINSLVKIAQEENDIATFTFLQWFVTEQIEEEASASDIVATLKMIGDKGQALYMLDKELGQRSLK